MENGAAYIDVILRDGTRCRMAPIVLDFMLRQKTVAWFRRSDGWVEAGSCPLRNRRTDPEYEGPERRSIGLHCEGPCSQL